jgi:hypothetical protein
VRARDEFCNFADDAGVLSITGINRLTLPAQPMYKIIGADRREYGPVNSEQILKWIAEGRANAQTRARGDDGADWKSLAEFSEFAAALAAKAPLPAAPPLIVRSEKPIPETAAFGIGDCLSRAWELYQSNFILCFGATAIILVLSIGLGSIHTLGWLAEAALGFALWGGLDFLFLKVIRGQTADIGDAFAGFKISFVPLVLGSLVAHVLTAAGFILLILPGIYLLAAWWMFTPLLIIDRRLDFWPAMELSRKTVNRNWWPCFGLLLLSLLIAFGGTLVCGIGLFFTLPIALIAIVFAYEKLFGQQPEPMGGIAPTPTKPTPAAGVETAANVPSTAPAFEPREVEAAAAPPIPDPKRAGTSGEPNPPEKPPGGSDPESGTSPTP